MSGQDFTVAVLIGGDSSRMGTDKATFEVEGSSMASRVVQAARDAGAAQVFLIGGPQSRAKGIDAVWKKDAFPGEGLSAESLLL